MLAPSRAQSGAAEEASLSEAERKKLESKRRKAEAKAKAEAEATAKAEAAEKAKEEKKKKAGGNQPAKPVDDDPDGAALASSPDPLGKATTYLVKLLTHAPGELRAYVLACELYRRKKRPLLLLRALRKARAIDADDPRVHRATILFLHEAAQQGASLPPTIAKVIDKSRGALGAPSGEPLGALNKAYLLRAAGRPEATLVAAELQLLLEPAERAAALALVSALDVAALTLPLAVRTHTLLAKTFGDAAAAAAFAERAVLRFPLADHFKP